MTTDYKLTCVIIDDFTSRSLSEFSAYDIQYYDYAKSYTSYTVDSYGYYLGYDYGDVDSYGIVPGSESYSWYNLNDLTGQSLSSFTGYNYLRASTGNFTDLYYGYVPPRFNMRLADSFSTFFGARTRRETPMKSTNLLSPQRRVFTL
jgi:hypothetical protein